ncbi:MAG TPA: tetratricopeptide repeat protein, partial [Thermoanaerobaculia bacterium]|nr:tetratricopeptide repeat protein [Thermoanaerobaculia bacterium]
AVAPPFDQGVFLLHYNRGREAFQEGRYAEARRELEAAQRLRPDDADVLNLLGLVYFKTNAFPEAEVIYRRLIAENPNVFILHSNLGLILFKQSKQEEAEHYLLRAVELRPNYAKSHLYLGLLYRQKKKFGLAIEHLRFAGADKLVREVEVEMRPPAPPTPPAPAPAPVPSPATTKPGHTTQKIPALTSERTMPGTVPTPASTAPPTEPNTKPVPAVTAPALPVSPRVVEPPPDVTAPISQAAITAARKLQDAVDEPQHVEAKRIDVARKIEGASKTFTLHENGFLEINFARSVHCKRGTVSSYSGNLKFVAESGLLGTTAQTLVKAVGQGKIFVYEKGRKTFLLDLHDEFIYVEGSNLLALEDSLTYRVEPIYDASYQRKIDVVKIFGKGSLAISTSIEPLTLRVTREYPLSISSNALVAWTGNIIPTVVDDKQLENVMIEFEGAAGFKIRFEGDGVVVSEQ